MDKNQLKEILPAYCSMFTTNQEQMKKILIILRARTHPTNKITLDVLDDLQVCLGINKNTFTTLLKDVKEACDGK